MLQNLGHHLGREVCSEAARLSEERADPLWYTDLIDYASRVISGDLGTVLTTDDQEVLNQFVLTAPNYLCPEYFYGD